MNEQDIVRILGSGWAEILAGTMLAGPLVVWMLYRLAFPRSDKAVRQAGAQMVPIPSEALWLCSRCTSLNLPGARRCYHCLTVRPANQPADVATVAAADVVEPSRAPLVPVMAPVTSLPVTSLPVTSLPQRPLPATPVPVTSLPVTPWQVTPWQVPVFGASEAPSPIPVVSSAPVSERESRSEPEPVQRAARRPVGVMAKRRRVPVALAVSAEPAAAGVASDATGPASEAPSPIPVASSTPVSEPESRSEPEPVRRAARRPVGVMAKRRRVPAALAVGAEPAAIGIASDATGPASEAKPLCPLLRGIGDARIVFTLPQPLPHPDYRCQAGRRPAAIESGHQAAYCLSAAYRSCERYLALAHRVSGTGAPDAREPDAPARSQLSG